MELLRRGEAAARAGQRSEARRYFRQILVLDPDSEDAWLWLGFLAPTPRQGLDYLHQARARHPKSQRVREAIIWAEERLARSRRRAAAEAPDRPRVDSASARQTSSQAHPAPTPAATSGRRAWNAPIGAALTVIVLALLAVGVAYALRRPAQQSTVPTALPSPSPSVTLLPDDMESLRRLASEAIEEGDWEQTILALERMRALTPHDDGVRQQLAVAHLRRGLEQADAGLLDEAIAHYDAAIRFYANDVDLQTARRIAISYRDGQRALEEGDWTKAAELLQPAYSLDPAFRDVADLLFTAHMERGKSLEESGELQAARDAYAGAVQVRPDDEGAETRLAAVMATLTPPTPTPTPRPAKRIVVSISEQRMRVYENDALLYDWVCSTGEPARPTRYGEFQVLDKIPNAWSSVWGLSMPYWLGIYWAGGSENGIHALPINQSGQQLWAGFLGSQVSFGCIILDTPNAATLYDWAEIGTPVTITP